jgi:hypothetical protein
VAWSYIKEKEKRRKETETGSKRSYETLRKEEEGKGPLTHIGGREKSSSRTVSGEANLLDD